MQLVVFSQECGKANSVVADTSNAVPAAQLGLGYFFGSIALSSTELRWPSASMKTVS